jgi:hypothetical protein
MTKSVAAHITLIAMAHLILSGVSLAQVSPQLASKATDASALTDAAQQQGHVRIIVQFSAPTLADQPTRDAAAIATVKTQIASIQDTIIASHFGSAANPAPGAGFPRGLLRFDITPMFAVNVSKAELDALAANPLVTAIHLDKANQPTLLQSVPLIGMTAAYGLGATGAGQAVAVVDTGVQSNHEFVAGKVVMEACFSNSGGGAGGFSLCPNGQASQSGTGAADPTTAECINSGTSLCIHGTHVAGIAAGNNTNPGGGKPANGVAKSAKIVAVQVFTRFNDTTNCGANAPCVLAFDSDLISALGWLVQNALTPAAGVSLASANMSLGGGSSTGTCDSDPVAPSIDSLRSVGVVTAIAAGNNGFTSAISSPGCISTAVAVGSTDKTDVISSFSNMSAQVALMAPGGFGGGACQFGANNPDILASIAATSSMVTTTYACLAGTSMATPHVAGAFAALRSACPTATIDQMLAVLKSTGLAITDTRSGGTVTKPRIRVDLAVQALSCGSPVATHDFNIDHKSDVVWRDTSNNVAIWMMNGTTVTNPSTSFVSTLPPQWAVVGQRDFNGDGKADLLWRDTSGNVAIWEMNGTAILNQNSSFVSNVPTPQWSVLGTGDFNGDTKGDILWQDTSGNVAIWEMNGTTVLNQNSSFVANVPAPWSIKGTGDFNGDGYTDILWMDTSGNVAIWEMNGTAIFNQSTSFVGTVPPQWSIKGTGDFNGDGKYDILWRDSSGNVAIWEMNGTTVLNASTSFVGNVAAQWSIQLTGDFNGDGKSDIIWHDSSGNVAIWEMNGTSVLNLSTSFVGTVPPSQWSIQGLNAN